MLRQVMLRKVTPDGGTRPTRSNLMDARQAREILGVSDDASDQAIIDAHRRLMQKVHPDKGGSAYLARQLNEAKRVLLQK